MVDLLKHYHVYILAKRYRGSLYTGVTSELPWRVYLHRNGLVGGFTRRYGIKRLVFYEQHGTMEDAILREKQIKRWKRRYKYRLIEKANPEWDDLYDPIVEGIGSAVLEEHGSRPEACRDDNDSRNRGRRVHQ